MDEEFEENVEATGDDCSVEPAESRRPFRALLDVGLIGTTTGNRVFGALKRANLLNLSSHNLMEDEPEKYHSQFSEYNLKKLTEGKVDRGAKFSEVSCCWKLRERG
ncbi:large ribosomal subunit protein uL18-like [Primulina eburnea]|uniref:large ribosomal subunit protein uL18-like n=1 Tax=Primulina eburnea TaxID=1245227 RepID=UPI003C6C4EA2